MPEWMGAYRLPSASFPEIELCSAVPSLSAEHLVVYRAPPARLHRRLEADSSPMLVLIRMAICLLIAPCALKVAHLQGKLCMR